MSLRFYTPATAAETLLASRAAIDAACESGALAAVDDRLSDKSRRRWRIEESDLLDWHRRGRPLVPEAAA